MGKITMKRRNVSYTKSWAYVFHLKSSSRFPLRRRRARSLSGFIADNCAARLGPTAVKSRTVLLSLRRSWMDGLRPDPRISRLDSWNAGRLTGEERAVNLI